MHLYEKRKKRFAGKWAKIQIQKFIPYGPWGYPKFWTLTPKFWRNKGTIFGGGGLSGPSGKNDRRRQQFADVIVYRY